MVREKKLSRSYILGALTGFMAMNALENAASLFTDPDFQAIRLLLLIIFGTASVVFCLMEYRKI